MFPREPDNNTLKASSYRNEKSFIETLDRYIRTPASSSERKELENILLFLASEPNFNFDLKLSEFNTYSIASALEQRDLSEETIYTLLVAKISNCYQTAGLVAKLLDVAEIGGFDFINAENSYNSECLLDVVLECRDADVRSWFVENFHLSWIDTGRTISIDRTMLNLAVEIKMFKDADLKPFIGHVSFEHYKDALLKQVAQSFRHAFKDRGLMLFEVREDYVLYNEETIDAVGYLISNSEFLPSDFLIENLSYAIADDYDVFSFGRDYGSNNLFLHYLERCNTPDLEMVEFFLKLGFKPFEAVANLNSFTKTSLKYYEVLTPYDFANEMLFLYEDKNSELAFIWKDVLSLFDKFRSDL